MESVSRLFRKAPDQNAIGCGSEGRGEWAGTALAEAGEGAFQGDVLACADSTATHGRASVLLFSAVDYQLTKINYKSVIQTSFLAFRNTINFGVKFRFCLSGF